MFTGKTVVCMHCCITLREKKFRRYTVFVTPWGARHHRKYCNFKKEAMA